MAGGCPRPVTPAVTGRGFGSRHLPQRHSLSKGHRDVHGPSRGVNTFPATPTRATQVLVSILLPQGLRFPKGSCVPWSAELLGRGRAFRCRSENSWAQLRPEDTAPALPGTQGQTPSRPRPRSRRPGQETARPGLCWPPSRPDEAAPRPRWPPGGDIFSPVQRTGVGAGWAPSVGQAVWRPSPRVAGAVWGGRRGSGRPHRGSRRPRT